LHGTFVERGDRPTDYLVTIADGHRLSGVIEMKKVLIGIVTALVLASCAYTAPAPQVSAKPVSASSGAGHPTGDYPGPRLY
jgi:hypothetical protein